MGALGGSAFGFERGVEISQKSDVASFSWFFAISKIDFWVRRCCGISGDSADAVRFLRVGSAIAQLLRILSNEILLRKSSMRALATG